VSKSDDLKLTEAERKFLTRFQKSVERSYINYISVGLLLCTAIVGLVIGIVRKEEGGFLMSIIFAGIGFILFIVTRKYQRIYQIISKLRADINEK